MRARVAAIMLVLSAIGFDRTTSAVRLTPGEAGEIIASLHPDHRRWIGTIRSGPAGADGGIYAGLVRPGGRDPRDPEDAPSRGRGVRNDLVIFPLAIDATRTPAWRILILDHEYFHARHLAGGFDVPLVSFGRNGIDRHYLEALAWGWVRGRAASGIYGSLPQREIAEVEERYRDHREAFMAFVMKAQPAAWAHYGRFLPDPAGLTLASSVP